MSGTYARRTTTITASMLSGWITPSRITDHYRYIEGPALSCSNIYPQLYSRVFYDKKKKPTA